MKNADVKQLFIDSTEKQCAVLGGDYLMNYLSYGVLSKGFCVVSDKRVYFKGKCYYKNQNKYNSATEQRIVDLKDITGTGIFHRKSYLGIDCCYCFFDNNVLWIFSRL